jgi:hypothetical protein
MRLMPLTSACLKIIQELKQPQMNADQRRQAANGPARGSTPVLALISDHPRLSPSWFPGNIQGTHQKPEPGSPRIDAGEERCW